MLDFLCSVFMPIKNEHGLQNMLNWDEFIVQAHKHKSATFFVLIHWDSVFLI